MSEIRSAIVRDCQITQCQYRRQDGTCSLPYIKINILKMCGYINTKLVTSEADYSPLSVLRSET